MDPKGIFLSFLNPYCMCGLTFEVNIQCLLPVLPAVSHSLNFVLSRMRPHSNLAHQNCLFLLQNKQNIALGPQPNLNISAKIEGQMCFHVTETDSVLWKTSTLVGVNIFRKNQVNFSNLLVHSFILVCVICNKNSPKGQFKPGPKSGHPLVQWMVH